MRDGEELMEAVLGRISPEILKELKGNYLITGASGFLGGWIVKALVYLNNTVWKDTPGHVKLLVRNADAIKVNDNNIEIYEYDPFEKINGVGNIDYIIHCAGICNSRLFISKPVDVLDVNLISTINLLKYAEDRLIKGMVFVSSGYIYSPDKEQPLEENAYVFAKGDITDYSSSYIVSKIAAECYCRSAYSQNGTPVNIIRPFNIYGPGLDLSHGGILTEVLKANMSRAIIMKSQGRAKRNFIHVLDVVSSVFYCLARGQYGEAYNVCSDKSISVADFVELATQLYCQKGINVELRRQVSDSVLTSDGVSFMPKNNKLRKLGWAPVIELREGLSNTIDFCVKTFKI